MVKFDDQAWPFRGQVIWLTPDQGGRRRGAIWDLDRADYCHTAHVPPHGDEEGGVASSCLRGFEPGKWASPAEGRWLLVENAGLQLVVPGAVIVVNEGARVTAYFHVHEIIEVEP
jgi:hypothetical protein